MAVIRVEWQANTAVVFIERPPVNAINLEVAEELRARVDELAADVPTGGLVITGSGRAFSSGVDFKEVPQYAPAVHSRMIRQINQTITTIYGLPTATVAAVNGHAIGGAFVVVLACDVRLAVDAEAKLGLSEVTAGIPYPACPMEVVRAELEPSYRRHLVLSGELIDPRTAHARGIIDALVAAEQLLPRAVELARSRAAAASYARVKEQLKGETLARMRAIIAGDRDPMLEHWV